VQQRMKKNQIFSANQKYLKNIKLVPFLLTSGLSLPSGEVQNFSLGFEFIFQKKMLMKKINDLSKAYLLKNKILNFAKRINYKQRVIHFSLNFGGETD